MKKLIYVFAALLIAGGAYWTVSEYCLEKEPVVETTEVVEESTIETVEESTIEADSVVVAETTIEEMIYDVTTIYSPNKFNTVETNE